MKKVITAESMLNLPALLRQARPVHFVMSGLDHPQRNVANHTQIFLSSRIALLTLSLNCIIKTPKENREPGEFQPRT